MHIISNYLEVYMDNNYNQPVIGQRIYLKTWWYS